MAPTVFTDGECDFSADVYAFAVTLYSIFAEPKEMDDGNVSRRSIMIIMRAVCRGARFLRKPEIPEYHWGVITRCWAQDPKSRPTFEMLLDEFHNSHECILPEADRSAVLEYENLIYSREKKGRWRFSVNIWRILNTEFIFTIERVVMK
jgi:hypothetical protein